MITIFYLWYIVVYGGLLYLLLQDPTIYAFANQHSSLFYALTMFSALVISVGPALVFVRTRPEEPKEDYTPGPSHGKYFTPGKNDWKCQDFKTWLRMNRQVDERDDWARLEEERMNESA